MEDCDQAPPPWSGLFWEDDDFGYISVHVSDERRHMPPGPGWTFMRTYACPEDDSQVFEYRRVCTEAPYSNPCITLVEGA